MFRMLIHPSSGACDYLVRYCVGCNVLTWGVLVLCSGIVCWWCGIRVQSALGYHITNSQSRYITPARLKSAQYSRHNNAPSSRKLLKMDVLTSETCWAVNWHNKANVIKLVYLYLSIIYYEYVSVALVIQHTMRLRRRLYSIFPHTLINCTIILKRYWTQNVCFHFLYNFCLKHFSFFEEFSSTLS